jgi:AbrB family looped-hinge helix DNA binding protein
VTAVKIGANRQIIIPKKAFEALGLASGDYLDVAVKDGSLVMSPKTLVDKPARHDGLADDAHPIGDQ